MSTTLDRLREELRELPKVKIRYSHCETGWAKVTTSGLYRLTCIPLAVDMNAYDLVRVSERRVSAFVERPFEFKTYVKYASELFRPGGSGHAALDAAKDVYGSIKAMCNDLGIACEGAVPGLLFLAHEKQGEPDEHLLSLSKNMGFSVSFESHHLPLKRAKGGNDVERN